MKKLVLAGISILAVVLLVLGSQSNVVGYQTVQSSVKERLNEKDLLFQTICDLVNNKEVQKDILESQGKFQNPFPTTQLTSFPTITKRQLNIIYFLGVVLFKMMGKARMESLVKAHPINVQTNEKINSIIGNNTKLREEMAQLSILNCQSCSNTTTFHSPDICDILWIVFEICLLLLAPFDYIQSILQIIGFLILFQILLPIYVIALITTFLLIVFECFYYWSDC